MHPGRLRLRSNKTTGLGHIFQNILLGQKESTLGLQRISGLFRDPVSGRISGSVCHEYLNTKFTVGTTIHPWFHCNLSIRMNIPLLEEMWRAVYVSVIHKKLLKKLGFSVKTKKRSPWLSHQKKVTLRMRWNHGFHQRENHPRLAKAKLIQTWIRENLG